MAGTLFTDVRILDCTGDEPYFGEVLVEAARVAAVVPEPQRLSREGVDVIDGRGATLMPGLIESHAHLSIDDAADLVQIGMIPPEETTLIAVRNARLYLDCGITSCISAASAKPRTDVVIRKAINKGEIPGPRLLAASPWLTVTGGLGDMRSLNMPHISSMAITLDGPEEFRRTTRELIREGVDIIKLVISGDTFVPHAPSHTTVMSEAEVAAAAEVVHAHGKRMSAHCRSADSVKLAVKHGVKELKRRGIRIPGGGDYGFFVTPHGENARDLDHLIRYCEFTPMEAMLSMTKHGGAAMDLPHELGQIQPGFLADLLLVAGDSLANPKVLLDRTKLLAVMKNGQFHRRPA